MRAVPSLPGVHVQVTAAVRHLCPFKQEIDDGRVTVSWRTDHATVELHSLRAFLGDFAESAISHEDLVSELWAALNALAGIRRVLVVATWKTAGMDVTCSTSPIPAVTP